MRLQGHSVKPAPRFYGQDDYHLGIELEVEAPTETDRRKGLELSKRPGYCYAKMDGSLGQYGWELVTHPISKSLWLNKDGKKNAVTSLFQLVNGLRQLDYTSHSNKRCGLHVHISHAAFGLDEDQYLPRGNVHAFWFMKTINSGLFRKLSQRTDEQLGRWCAIVGVGTKNFFQRIGTRYLATNVTNKTIEVRIFRGNLREDRVRKCVESVIAAAEFTRGLKSTHLKHAKQDKEWLTREFLAYIAQNSKDYNNLYNFLVEIGQINETKEVKEVCV